MLSLNSTGGACGTDINCDNSGHQRYVLDQYARGVATILMLKEATHVTVNRKMCHTAHNN